MLAIGVCGGFLSKKFKNSFFEMLYFGKERKAKIAALELGID